MPITVPIQITGDSPPFIMTEVRWAGNGASCPIRFVVDTGAFDATLSEDDTDDLGASVDDLPESESRVAGIGGTVRSFDMQGVSVIFAGDDGQTRTVPLKSIRVMENPSKRHKEQKRAFIPSLLGRRFMEEHGFTLFWDFPKRVAVLEIE